jgi:hypothetical protein
VDIIIVFTQVRVQQSHKARRLAMHALTERLDQEDRAGCVLAKRELQSFSHFRVSKDTKASMRENKKTFQGPDVSLSVMPKTYLCSSFVARSIARLRVSHSQMLRTSLFNEVYKVIMYDRSEGKVMIKITDHRGFVSCR